MASLVPAAPYLFHAPRGDGHPVLVMPGFGASDNSTIALRGFLSSTGYDVHPWNLGTNRGPGMPDLQARLAERLDAIFAESGDQKVSLVGWSLGGVYARMLAHRYPNKVCQVITLGSPIGGSRRSPTNTSGPIASSPLPGVPSSAIFSKTDAIVPWEFATQQPSEIADNIEVHTSHTGLGFSPAVFYAIADRLAQQTGNWQPFQRSGWKRIVYGAAELQPGDSSHDQAVNPNQTS